MLSEWLATHAPEVARRWPLESMRALRDYTRLKAELPYRATAYAMRHTFINEALRNGAPETAIAEVVGHEDTTMINKVYGHPSLHQDLLDSVVQKANKRAAS